VTAKFRAYSSYAESFADYAKLMKDSPRYAGVVASAGTPAPSRMACRRPVTPPTRPTATS
jgi:flagellum-specific peptidoglycan hydrolase FlgJ